MILITVRSAVNERSVPPGVMSSTGVTDRTVQFTRGDDVLMELTDAIGYLDAVRVEMGGAPVIGSDHERREFVRQMRTIYRALDMLSVSLRNGGHRLDASTCDMILGRVLQVIRRNCPDLYLDLVSEEENDD